MGPTRTKDNPTRGPDHATCIYYNVASDVAPSTSLEMIRLPSRSFPRRELSLLYPPLLSTYSDLRSKRWSRLLADFPVLSVISGCGVPMAIHGGVIEREDRVRMEESRRNAVYMCGYLPGASPEKSPMLSPTPVRDPGGDSWRDVFGGGCGFAMAVSGESLLPLPQEA